MVYWVHPSLNPKWHLDRISRFRRAYHVSHKHTDNIPLANTIRHCRMLKSPDSRQGNEPFVYFFIFWLHGFCPNQSAVKKQRHTAKETPFVASLYNIVNNVNSLPTDLSIKYLKFCEQGLLFYVGCRATVLAVSVGCQKRQPTLTAEPTPTAVNVGCQYVSDRVFRLSGLSNSNLVQCTCMIANRTHASSSSQVLSEQLYKLQLKTSEMRYIHAGLLLPSARD